MTPPTDRSNLLRKRCSHAPQPPLALFAQVCHLTMLTTRGRLRARSVCTVDATSDQSRDARYPSLVPLAQTTDTSYYQKRTPLFIPTVYRTLRHLSSESREKNRMPGT